MKVLPSNSRRGWLLRILTAAISLSVLVILYPVAWFLRPRKATVSGAMEVTAPFRVSEIITTESNPFNFGGRPCLVVLTPGGANRLATGEPLLSDDVRAFDAVCTHIDCTVKFRPDRQDIFCNCHDGVYDLNGKNISGPPPRPLEAYHVALRGEVGNEEIVISRKT